MVLIYKLSKSISRVLYLTVICLGHTFRYGSSHLQDWRAANMSQSDVAPGGVYIDRQVTMPLVSSYLTFPPLPSKRAVYLCCTFLKVAFTGSYPAPLPCGARTFLICATIAHPRPSGLLKMFIYLLRTIIISPDEYFVKWLIMGHTCFLTL